MSGQCDMSLSRWLPASYELLLRLQVPEVASALVKVSVPLMSQPLCS
jgi:hypothetical protein